MTNQTISELLLLLFLAISCSRIFFIKNVRSDPLALLPLIAFLLSVCNVFAWGVSIPEAAVCGLSFFVTLWNFRALLRLNGSLIIDHYSVRFIFISMINLGLTVLLAVPLFVFRPVRTDLHKFGVQKTVTAYKGSFSRGFREPEQPFERKTAFVTTYRAKENRAAATKAAGGEVSPSGADAENNPVPQSDAAAAGAGAGGAFSPSSAAAESSPVPQNDAAAAAAGASGRGRGTVLFIPNECAGTAIYEPFCAKLARDGWTVHTADFHSADAPWLGGIRDTQLLRRFLLVLRRLAGDEAYAELAALRTKRLEQAFTALLSLTAPDENDTVFLVCDGGTRDALFSVQKNSTVTDGSFDLSDIADYPTKGFGPVEQTDPLLATVLGVHRDGSLYMASHIATVLEEQMQAVAGTAN